MGKFLYAIGTPLRWAGYAVFGFLMICMLAPIAIGMCLFEKDGYKQVMDSFRGE